MSNAMGTITITVTQEDIKNARGHEGDASHCVIAQAIMRQTQANKPDQVAVLGFDEIVIDDKMYEGATEDDQNKIGDIIDTFDNYSGEYIRRGKITLREVE